MLKLLGPIMGLLGGGSLVSYGVLAVGISGVSLVVYNHGKTVERGKQAERIVELVEDRDKIADNFTQSLVNLQAEHYEELRRVSARSKEIVEATENWFNASDRARQESRKNMAEYKAELVRLEERSVKFQTQLKEAHNAWLEQNTPFDLVCDIYNGVLDIDDCTRLADTRTDHSDEDSE